MAALQSYLQDADAILAQANSAPPSGIDQYLADADAILQESQQAVTPEAIQAVTGGEGVGGSLTRGLLRTAQAVSRPLAWAMGDTDKLNAEQQATRDAETSGTGTAIQEVTNLAVQMGLTAPLTAAIAAPLHLTRMGRLAGASRTAAKAAGIGGKQLAARGVINAADNAIQMGLQSGLESGASAMPHGALLGAAGGAVGGPIANPVGRALAEGTVYAAGPAAVEGRAPTLEEGVYGYAFPIIQALAKVKSPSRSEMAKALGVKPQELPPELATQEGRARAVEEARGVVDSEAANAQRMQRDNDLFAQPREEVIQDGQEVQRGPEEVATTPEQVVDQSPAGPEPVGAAPEMQPAPVIDPTTSAEGSPTHAEKPPESQPQPPPPTSFEPAPFDVPEQVPVKNKGRKSTTITEGDDALESFRSHMRRSGIRPPQGMTGEDFGKAFPFDYIKDDGAYTWDQSLQEAAELGLIHPNATPDEFRDLFSGKVNRRVQVEPDAQTNVDRIPKQSEREVANDDMDVGDLVYRNGEWHRVIDATEDGLTLKDGEETQVGYSGTITAKGVVKPGMEEYNYAMAEYRKQEQANNKFLDLSEEEFAQMSPDEQARLADEFEASERAAGRMPDEPVAPPPRVPDGKGKLVEPEPPQEPPQGEPPPIPERPESTGTKNAVREEQRIARGLEPIESKPGAKHEDLIAEGRKRLEANSALPDEIMARLNDDGKRAIAVGDEAVMMAEDVRVRKEYHDTLDRLGNPKLSDAERAVARKRQAELEDRLNQIDEAERVAGSEWGQFGNLRQRLIREDYSLVGVLRKASAEKGSPIHPGSEEYKIIESRVKELEAKLEEIQVHKGARPAAEIDAEIDRIIAELDVAPAESKLGSAATKAKGAVSEFTAAWHELMGGGRLGVTPQAFNELSYAKAKPRFENSWKLAKESGKDVIEFMREEIAKYGKGVKPYISRFVNENKLEMAPPETDEAIAKMKAKAATGEKVDTKKQRATIEERLSTRYGEGDTLDDMRGLVHRLALNFVRDGVGPREPLIDKVHAVLKRIDPKATRTKTRELISDYGKFKPLDKEPAKVKLRGYKGEMQQIGKIEDMKAGRAPKKTGMERRTPTDIERAFIKEVNDLKRKGGFNVTDPETQLKSAMDAVKTRLRNEINDLDNAIADNAPIPSKKNELQYDAEAKALRAQRDAKKKQYDELFKPTSDEVEAQRERALVKAIESAKNPKPGKSKEQTVDSQRVTELKQELDALRQKRADAARPTRILNALDSSIAKLEDDIKAGVLYKSKGRKVSTPEIEVKRAQLDALRAERQLLRDLDTQVVESKREAALVKALEEAQKNLPKQPAVRPTVDTAKVAALKQSLADVRAKNAGLRKAARDADTMAVESKRERDLFKAIERAEKGVAPPQKATVDTQRVAELKAKLKVIREGKRAGRADEIALNAYKARTLRQIADIQERIAKGELEPKKRGKIEVNKDAEATRLEFELQKKKTEIDDLLFAYRLKNRTNTQKVIDEVVEDIGWIRAVRGSGDFSALGRQLILDLLAHPLDAPFVTRQMLRAMRSPENEFAIMQSLKNSPNANDYKATELFIHDRTNPSLASREEAYRSRRAQKTPFVAMSERGYITAINVLRARRYDAMKATLLRKGFNDDMAAKKIIANYINIVTGRGGGKSFEKAANVLSVGFWSPRLMLSRFQYILGQPLWTKILDRHADPAAVNAARKIIAAEYGRTALGAGVVLGLAAAAGVRIGVNPQSSDFGKIIVGKTRYDIFGGILQPMVYLSRTVPALFMEKTVTNSKGKKSDLDLKTLTQFWLYKSAPIIQTGIQLITGKDVIGQPVSKIEALLTAPIPLTLEQFIDSMQEDPPAKAILDTAISATGIGVNTYAK